MSAPFHPVRVEHNGVVWRLWPQKQQAQDAAQALNADGRGAYAPAEHPTRLGWFLTDGKSAVDEAGPLTPFGADSDLPPGGPSSDPLWLYCREIWDSVLVPVCGAFRVEDADLAAFVSHIRGSKVFQTEWRFQGLLGFGGKVRSDESKLFWVDCYPEDATEERKAIVERANAALKALWLERVPQASSGAKEGRFP